CDRTKPKYRRKPSDAEIPRCRRIRVGVAEKSQNRIRGVEENYSGCSSTSGRGDPLQHARVQIQGNVGLVCVFQEAHRPLSQGVRNCSIQGRTEWLQNLE